MSVKRTRIEQPQSQPQSQEYQYQEQNSNPFADAIRQRALQARMSVSSGHLTLNSSIPSYMSDFQRQQEANNARRVTLNQQQQLPALVSNVSTASSLTEWESNNSLDNFKKRSIDDVIEDKEIQLADYIQRHGPLSFNEDF